MRVKIQPNSDLTQDSYREISWPAEVHQAKSLIALKWRTLATVHVITLLRGIWYGCSGCVKRQKQKCDSFHLVKLFSQVTNDISILQAAEHLSGDDTWNTTEGDWFQKHSDAA